MKTKEYENLFWIYLALKSPGFLKTIGVFQCKSSPWCLGRAANGLEIVNDKFAQFYSRENEPVLRIGGSGRDQRRR